MQSTGQAGMHSSQPVHSGSITTVSYTHLDVYKRQERTELSHIEEWLRSLALARPDVELRVSHNGKPSRRWKGEGDLLSDMRLHEALGEDLDVYKRQATS